MEAMTEFLMLVDHVAAASDTLDWYTCHPGDARNENDDNTRTTERRLPGT